VFLLSILFLLLSVIFHECRKFPRNYKSCGCCTSLADTNDNEPAFDPQSYSVEIREDVAIGTSVAMVSATDTDSGRFSSYCIKKSNKKALKLCFYYLFYFCFFL
jgi:hypothetical protein